MALVMSNVFMKSSIRILEDKLFSLSLTCNATHTRERHYFVKPRLRNPTWFVRKTRSINHEYLTPENKAFLKEVVEDKYNVNVQREPGINIEWTPKMQRTGLIARKIGIYPLWFQNGKRIQTTLLQILDNHVIKYYAPDEFDPPRKRSERVYTKKGCLLLGAEGADPSTFTREYCGLFKESGVIPKKFVGRFFVSPDAVIPIGTLLNVMHFQVGNVVDIRGKTIDRGFQGVMKRHGFKGMPASHGVTKTHRRGGNIGGGGEKGRVWPGTKMPGHMGNRYRVAKGLQILRINTKHNVMWVTGQAIPGETNSIVYIFDSKLPLRKPKAALPFPTYYGALDENTPEDLYDENVHKFTDPPITYQPTK